MQSVNALHWLFVTPFYKPAYVYGGPIYSISTLCETLVELGSQVTVFTTNANGRNNLTLPPTLAQNVQGVQVYYFRRDLPGSYFYSKQLTLACCKLIRSSVFDILYLASNWAYPFIPACWASLLAKVPYIVSPRASFKKNTWRGKYLKKISYHLLVERFLIQKASLIHYTTIQEANSSSWLHLTNPKVIIPNPINFEVFDTLPLKGCFRKKFNVPAHQRIILILGRIDPEKGLELALQSLKKVVEQIPDVLLVIAGPEEDNYLCRLQKWAEDLEITNHLLFTGLLDASERLESLVDADLLFSPSRSENFGMSIVEGMACGLPVVVTDQVGVADLISREKAGLVVPLDTATMAEGLIRLLKDPSLCREYSWKAARVVRERFSAQDIALTYLQIFGTYVNHQNV